MEQDLKVLKAAEESIATSRNLSLNKGQINDVPGKNMNGFLWDLKAQIWVPVCNKYKNLIM